HRGPGHQALPEAAREVQDSEAGGVRRRAAQDLVRQDRQKGAVVSDAPQPVRPPMACDKNALRIDCEAESDRIADAIRRQVRSIRRKGVVLGLSGGIDSSVTAALAVRSLGPKRVVGICMPESDSDPQSLTLGRLVAERYGIRCIV